MKKNSFIAMIALIGVSIAIFSQKESIAEPVATQQEAIRLLDKFIKENGLFSVKLNQPLLPGKLAQWQQRKIIHFPSGNISWNTFVKDIQQLGAYLHQLKAPENIKILLNNKQLYEALKALEKKISEYNPSINTSTPFGIDKKSIEALQKAINSYGTQFYSRNLLVTIQNSLKQSEKQTEEELKKAEEKKKEALAQAPVDLEDNEQIELDLDEAYDQEFQGDFIPESADYEDEEFDIKSFFFD